jgi:hypothetical protein
MRGIGAGLGVAAAALMAFTTPASAQPGGYWYHGHHYWRCRENQHQHAVAGTVIGAVAGGLLGSAIGHGRAGGTLVGAGVGAYAGHQIGRSSHPC